MDYCAMLLSLKKLDKNQYEATFTYDGNEYVKRFEVLEHAAHEEISIDDRDLEPRLVLSDDTRRALFAFHRAFNEPNPVEKRSLVYQSRIRPSENSARTEADEKKGKKILSDPDTDLFHQPLK